MQKKTAMQRFHVLLAFLWLALLLALAGTASAAPAGGLLSPGGPPPKPAAPHVSFVNCPDAPQLLAITQSIPASLWPAGTHWVITEYDEAAWPKATLLYWPWGISTANDGFMVYSTDPQGFRGIFLRRHAPDGTPVARILCHELGHVVWPGLVDTNTHSLMDLMPLLRIFGGGECEYILPGQQSPTEEAFADAFAANRFDRASAGNEWGQQYIDSLFAVAPPSVGRPIGGPVLPAPPEN